MSEGHPLDPPRTMKDRIRPVTLVIGILAILLPLLILIHAFVAHGPFSN